jgi:hypothetical protein
MQSPINQGNRRVHVLRKHQSAIPRIQGRALESFLGLFSPSLRYTLCLAWSAYYLRLYRVVTEQLLLSIFHSLCMISTGLVQFDSLFVVLRDLLGLAH